MLVSRDLLLRCLDAVSAGLSKGDIVEQSSCFVFKQGMVCTYNDEISCQMASPLDIEGAVAAAPLMALLQKLSDDHVNVTIEDGELLVKKGTRRAGIRCDQTISLPIDNVTHSDDWRPLHEDFADAVDIVSQSAGKNDSEFVLTCVHISPDYVEACDNYQMTRFPLATGFETDVLVRGASIKQIVGLDMTEFSETDNWLHFRNPAGLVYSTRRHLDEYPDLAAFADTEGESATLPPGLVEAVDKAQIFSSDDAASDQITIDLRPGKLLLEGRGTSGWYQEMKKVSYNGDPVKFTIAPKLLRQILLKAHDCEIATGRILIKSGKFVYVSCTGVVEKREVAVV